VTSLARAFAALALIFASGLAHGGALEHGLAIDDASTLRELDAREKSPNERSLSLGVMLGASRGAFSAEIFSLPSMISMRATLDREFDDYAKRGEKMPMELRARIRADIAMVPRLCRDAVIDLLTIGGAAGLSLKSPIQMAARNLIANCMHGFLLYDSGMEIYGRVLLGLDPGTAVI